MRVRQACTCAGGLADGGYVFVMSNFATEHDNYNEIGNIVSPAHSNYSFIFALTTPALLRIIHLYVALLKKKTYRKKLYQYF